MQLVVSKYNDPAINLALEEFLFNKTDEEFVLFYINSPSVIIGCNQILQNEVNEGFCKSHDIPIYRRISGGGAVYHDLGNLSYSFIRNKADNKTNLSADFLNPIVFALKSFGIQSVVGKRKDLWLPDENKISGTAAHLTAKRVLHHGTLLYDTDLDKLSGALSSSMKNTELKGIASVPSPVKNIKTFLEENGLKSYITIEFFQIIINQVKIFHQVTKEYSFDNNAMVDIELLALEKYRNESWNRRK
jgi:lipoate-protein ligase A